LQLWVTHKDGENRGGEVLEDESMQVPLSNQFDVYRKKAPYQKGEMLNVTAVNYFKNAPESEKCIEFPFYIIVL
jgi:hypothetical protein